MNVWTEIAAAVGDLAGHAGSHPVALTQAMVAGAAAQLLLGHTLGGYYDGLVKRADRWMRGGEPVAGLGTFLGRVVAVRDAGELSAERGASRNEAAQRAVIEIVRTQRHNGSDVWRDVHVAVHAEAFRLELSAPAAASRVALRPEPAAQDEVEVLPDEPLLSGFEETSVLAGRAMREIRSAVYPDEQVWVTGYLEPAVKGLGAYRGGGGRRRLRAPRGGKVWLTRQAPAEEWRKLATAHRRGGWAALGGLVITMAVAYPGTLSVWLSRGEAAAPPLSASVVLLWAVLASIAIGSWVRGYRKARRDWALRFPWL